MPHIRNMFLSLLCVFVTGVVQAQTKDDLPRFQESIDSISYRLNKIDGTLTAVNRISTKGINEYSGFVLQINNELINIRRSLSGLRSEFDELNQLNESRIDSLEVLNQWVLISLLLTICGLIFASFFAYKLKIKIVALQKLVPAPTRNLNSEVSLRSDSAHINSATYTDRATNGIEVNEVVVKTQRQTPISAPIDIATLIESEIAQAHQLVIDSKQDFMQPVSIDTKDSK